MAVDIKQIKELRDATGVSMTACKKALEEANGSFEEAVDLLRKKGAAKAASRAERGTANGLVRVKSDGGKTAIVALGCETDFVSMGDEFAALADALLDKVLSGEVSVEERELEMIKEAVLKLGENIQILNIALVEGGTIGSYVHSNGKIGVLVALDGGSEDVAKDIAMHAAATAPKVLSPSDISDELVAHEKEIWTEQLASEGKPVEIMEKIMIGKEAKFRGDNALISQKFVKNPDITVEQFAKDAGAIVKSFVRFTA